jgi:hypothetical protein
VFVAQTEVRWRAAPSAAVPAGLVAVPPTTTVRAAVSAKLWAIAEHHIVAEWICCEPLDPKHDLCAKGYAALGMAKTLLVDSDPEEAWNPAAPVLDAVMAMLPPPADRIAAPTVWIDGHPQLEAIAAAVWESCRTEDTSLVVDDPRNIAVAALDAVLAVLPAGFGDTTTTRADILREAADRFDRHAEQILHGVGELAVFVAKARRDQAAVWREAAETLRRLAAETQPSEAHPAEHKWAAELYDPLAEQWVPGTRYADRDRAVNALAHGKRVGPAWKDGTPTERRLVRTTTTYTVEQPAASAGVQTDTAHEPPQRSRTARFLNALTHTGPGYDLTPDASRQTDEETSR